MIRLKPILDSCIRIIKWDTDLEDYENILRIESQQVIEIEITNMLCLFNTVCIALI